jgi:hypothetical protein
MDVLMMAAKMNVQSKAMTRQVIVGAGFCLFVGMAALPVCAEDLGPVSSKYYSVSTVQLSDGMSLEKTIISGPPKPPPGFELERQSVALPEPDVAGAVKTLTVPAYNWVFGCSAVSGSMIAGYHDRNGYSNMYTGPTNGGVMPLDNSLWPTFTDVEPATYRNNPLVASKNGVDGRTIRGSIDDYWIQYSSTASDPYVTGAWTQHAWGSAIGDYMKTSQSAYGNTDGSTTFYNWTSSATRLNCSDMPGYDIDDQDGTYGRKLFYEARGYTVTDCYNQKTDNTIAGGFSFAQFKAEIDAGRPVMLNLAGHTIVGVGYDDSTNLVYIHDTWDYLNHTMTWGASYSGMALQSVSVVNLQSVSQLYATFTGFGLYSWNGTIWTKINTIIPTKMVPSGTNLYASFTGYGLYKWNGTAWTRINTSLPTNMVATSTDLYASFTGYGLYKWNGTTWTRINTVLPTSMAIKDTSLYASFTGYGLYKWDGIAWSRLNTSIPTSMVPVD